MKVERFRFLSNQSVSVYPTIVASYIYYVGLQCRLWQLMMVTDGSGLAVDTASSLIVYHST